MSPSASRQSGNSTAIQRRIGLFGSAMFDVSDTVRSRGLVVAGYAKQRADPIDLGHGGREPRASASSAHSSGPDPVPDGLLAPTQGRRGLNDANRAPAYVDVPGWSDPAMTHPVEIVPSDEELRRLGRSSRNHGSAEIRHLVAKLTYGRRDLEGSEGCGVKRKAGTATAETKFEGMNAELVERRRGPANRRTPLVP
jgi:hypothetical protein